MLFARHNSTLYAHIISYFREDPLEFVRVLILIS